eukprot:8958179-Pyramimonas_sp.AAC.1
MVWHSSAACRKTSGTSSTRASRRALFVIQRARGSQYMARPYPSRNFGSACRGPSSGSASG